MKTVRDFLLASIGIVLLVVVVFLIAPGGFFPLDSSGHNSGYPSPTEKSPTSIAESAYPLENLELDTSIVEAPILAPVIPTRIPIIEGAFFASDIQILSQKGDVEITKVYNYDVDGDSLVLKANLNNGGTALLLINLLSGTVEKLLEVPEQQFTGFNNLQISGQYIIWLDSSQEPKTYERLLQVFDLEKGEAFTLQKGKIEQIDLRENIVVWVDSVDQGFIAYDLVAQHMQPITLGSERSGFPRVCSKEWIAYLHNFSKQEQFVQTTSADLSIYHLPTGKRVLAGNASGIPNIPGVRNTSFDCDAQSLAWVTRRDDPEINNNPELHVYNFSTAKDRVIQELVDDLKPYDNFVLIEGSLVISNVGYDLERNKVFSPFPGRASLFGPLYLSNNRLVWVEDHDNNAGNIFLTLISTGGEE